MNTTNHNTDDLSDVRKGLGQLAQKQIQKKQSHMCTSYHQKTRENHTDNTRKEGTVHNKKLNFLY